MDTEEGRRRKGGVMIEGGEEDQGTGRGRRKKRMRKKGEERGKAL